MNLNLIRFFSSALRGSILFLRFILTFYIAKYTSPEEVGLFALYWGGLILASSLMGLDVYTHTTRLILTPKVNKPKVLATHIGFLLISCIIFTPIFTLLFYNSSLEIPFFLVIIFVFHLPFEYFSQEVSRLLIPLKRPTVSIVLLFVRSALWIPIVIIGLIYKWNFDPLELIVISWLTSSILSSILSYCYLNIMTKNIILPLINISWIKASIVSSGIFFIGTILFRAILGGDRFFVGYYLGVNILGVYSIYASVSLGVLALLESGVSAWRYPTLVTAIQSKDIIGAKIKLWSFWKDNFISSFILMLSVVFVFRMLAETYLDKVYFQGIIAFYIISFGVFVYSISMPFHYFIYGLGKDHAYIYIYALSFFSMLVWVFGYMSSFGLIGASIMLTLALVTIALLRGVFFILYLRLGI